MAVDLTSLRFTLPRAEVDRSGLARFTILIRGPEDPDRAPRWSEREENERGERPTDDARKRTRMTREKARAALLADIVAHPGTTYNAACVRCFGTTADVTNEDVEAALWSLVDNACIVHTLEAPIRFIATTEIEIVEVTA